MVRCQVLVWVLLHSPTVVSAKEFSVKLSKQTTSWLNLLIKGEKEAEQFWREKQKSTGKQKMNRQKRFDNYTPVILLDALRKFVSKSGSRKISCLATAVEQGKACDKVNSLIFLFFFI